MIFQLPFNGISFHSLHAPIICLTPFLQYTLKLASFTTFTTLMSLDYIFVLDSPICIFSTPEAPSLLIRVLHRTIVVDLRYQSDPVLRMYCTHYEDRSGFQSLGNVVCCDNVVAYRNYYIWLPGAMVARLASIADGTKRLQVRVLRWSYFCHHQDLFDISQHENM